MRKLPARGASLPPPAQPLPLPPCGNEACATAGAPPLRARRQSARNSSGGNSQGLGAALSTSSTERTGVHGTTEPPAEVATEVATTAGSACASAPPDRAWVKVPTVVDSVETRQTDDVP